MCRNIRTLFNFDPPATDEEVRAAAIQFERKVSGTVSPSKANQAAFDKAVEDVHAAVATLLGEMQTTAPPKDREVERERAKARNAVRFGR